MKGIRSIPKILKINRIEGKQISCLFSNGETRIIDFTKIRFGKEEDTLFDKHPILKDQSEFAKIEIIENSVGWRSIGKEMKDFNGEIKFYPYEIDPLVVYKQSIKDESESLGIGKLIRKIRKEEGLSQEELAKRIGTSKHYISRIENEKSDIELLTLKKIVEAGLRKEIEIEIH